MLEKVWYELSPITYSIVSCLAMFYTNILGIVFASLLLIASVLIGVMRIQSRFTHKAVPKARKAKSIYIK
jgi:Na+-transporting methylmalonyl-CoA/oxaloacetate decarboxylase gamma subunit